MSIGNAWKHAPARQARLQRDMQNPEWLRRREIYRKARGSAAKRLVAHWNVDWNLAGRPADFPDFPEWKAANAHRFSGVGQ
jgi:hypothetical protein